jgi:hypothetical protein
MRKSAPVAAINASDCGSIMPGGGGGATAAISSGRFSDGSEAERQGYLTMHRQGDAMVEVRRRSAR